MSFVKGEARERTLPESAYFTPGYFDLAPLFSVAHQIHDLHGLKPENILEIGIGNGFTSSFLKRAGFDVVTVDINKALNPDICAPISQMGEFLEERRFDLIACCEVLEHMPFDQFESSIEIFRNIGKRLYITLPNYRFIFGFGGFFNRVAGRPLLVDMRIELPGFRTLNKEHFWEVGSSAETKKREIVKLLRNHYSSVRVGRYLMNPRHISFYAHN